MQIEKIKINDPNGLHMRKAVKIVEFAKKYKSKIYLWYESKVADSHSILEVLTLAAAKDAEISVIAEGPDEKEVINKIGEFITRKGDVSLICPVKRIPALKEYSCLYREKIYYFCCRKCIAEFKKDPTRYIS